MRYLGPCSLILGFAGSVAAADIDVVGHWAKTVTRADLVAGAGTDIMSPLESPAAIATLNISNTGGSSWVVRVTWNNIDWAPGASVAVRRSGNEAGINGGTSYQSLDGSPQDFFCGTGDYSGIQIQFKVDGVTIQTAPQPYSLLVTYAVESPAPCSAT